MATKGVLVHSIDNDNNDMQVSNDIINVLAETYVNRIKDNPSAPRCEFCRLLYMVQKCHKLINVAVANRILNQHPQLERQIIAEKNVPSNGASQVTLSVRTGTWHTSYLMSQAIYHVRSAFIWLMHGYCCRTSPHRAGSQLEPLL